MGKKNRRKQEKESLPSSLPAKTKDGGGSGNKNNNHGGGDLIHLPPHGSVKKKIQFSAVCFVPEDISVDKATVVITYCEKPHDGKISEKDDQSSLSKLIVLHSDRHDFKKSSSNNNSTNLMIGNVPMKMKIHTVEVDIKLHRNMVLYYHYEAADRGDNDRDGKDDGGGDRSIFESLESVMKMAGAAASKLLSNQEGKKVEWTVYREDCLRTLRHVEYNTGSSSKHRQEDVVVFFGSGGSMERDAATITKQLWQQSLSIRMMDIIYGRDSVSKCNELLKTGNLIWEKKPQEKFLDQVQTLADRYNQIHQDFIAYTEYKHYAFCARFDRHKNVIGIDVVSVEALEGSISHHTHTRLQQEELSSCMFRALFLAQRMDNKYDMSARILVALLVRPEQLLNEAMEDVDNPSNNLSICISADMKTLVEDVLNGQDGNKFRRWLRNTRQFNPTLGKLLRNLKNHFGGWKEEISYGWIRAYLLFRALGGTIVQWREQSSRMKNGPVSEVMKEVLTKCYLHQFVPVNDWNEDILIRLQNARPVLIGFHRDQCSWEVVQGSSDSDCIDPTYIKRAIQNMLIGSSESVQKMLLYSRNDIGLMLDWLNSKIVGAGGTSEILIRPKTIGSVVNDVCDVLVISEAIESEPTSSRSLNQMKLLFTKIAYMQFDDSFSTVCKLFSSAYARYGDQFTTADMKELFSSVVERKLRAAKQNILVEPEEDEMDTTVNEEGKDVVIIDVESNFDDENKYQGKGEEDQNQEITNKKKKSKSKKRIVSLSIFKYPTMKEMLDTTNGTRASADELRNCLEDMIVKACRRDLNGVLERFFELQWDSTSYANLEWIWTRGMESAASERSDAIHTFVDVIVKHNQKKNDKVRIMSNVLDKIVDDILMSAVASQDDTIETKLLSPLQCPIFHTLIDLYKDFSEDSKRKIAAASKIFAQVAAGMLSREVDISLLRKDGLLDEHQDRFLEVIYRIRSSLDAKTIELIPECFDRTHIQDSLHECFNITTDLDLIKTARECIVDVANPVPDIDWESSFYNNSKGKTLQFFKELHEATEFQLILEDVHKKYTTLAMKLQSGELTFGEIQNVNFFEGDKLKDYVRQKYNEEQAAPFGSQLEMIELYEKIQNVDVEIYNQVIGTITIFLFVIENRDTIEGKSTNVDQGDTDISDSDAEIHPVELEFLKMLPVNSDDSILSCSILFLSSDGMPSWARLVLDMVEYSTTNPMSLETNLNFLSMASTRGINLIQWWTENFPEAGDIERFADVCRATSLGESDLDSDRLRGLELLAPALEPIVVFKTKETKFDNSTNDVLQFVQNAKGFTNKSMKCFCGQSIADLLKDIFGQLALSPRDLIQTLETYSEDIAWLVHVVSNQNSLGSGVGETIKDIDTNGRFVVPRSGGDVVVDWPTEKGNTKPLYNAETLKNINDRSTLLTMDSKSESTDRFALLYDEVQKLSQVMKKLHSKGVPLLANAEVKIYCASSSVEVHFGLQHHVLVETGKEFHSIVYIVRELRRKFECLISLWDEEIHTYQKKNMFLNKMSESEIIRMMKILCVHDTVRESLSTSMEIDGDGNDNDVICIDVEDDRDDPALADQIEANLCFQYLVCDEDFNLDPELEEVAALKQSIQSSLQCTFPQRNTSCHTQTDEELFDMLTSMGWDPDEISLGDKDRKFLFASLFQSGSTSNEREGTMRFDANEHGSTISERLEKLWNLFSRSWNEAEVLFVGKQGVEFTGGVSLSLLDLLLRPKSNLSVDNTLHDSMAPASNDDKSMTIAAALTIPTNSLILNMECENPILLVMKLLCTQNKMAKADDVLFCSADTSLREMIRFIDRVFPYVDEITDVDVGSLMFYLVGVENLRLGIAEESVKLLRQRLQLYDNTMRDNRQQLCIICSSDCKGSAYVSVAFAKDSFEIPPNLLTSENKNNNSIVPQEQIVLSNSNFCLPGSNTQVLTAKTGGGKSWIWKQELKQVHDGVSLSDLCVIPLWESFIDESELCQRILEFSKKRLIYSKGTQQWNVRLILIVKSQVIFENIDEILFKIAILGILRSNDGRRWRFTSNCSLRIECSEIDTSVVLPYLQRYCVSSPQGLLVIPNENFLVDGSRPKWQLDFILDHNSNYSFVAENIGGRHQDACRSLDRNIKMKAILRTCMETLGSTNPSWRRLYEFISGARIQLMNCQNSIFVNEISGLRNVVLEHTVIQMVRDFLSPMNDGPTVEGQKRRRKWEESPQPYLFFNDDGISLSFVGFHVDMRRNVLLDDNGNVIKHNVFSNELITTLEPYIRYRQLDLSENFGQLSRTEKLNKLRRIFGSPKSSDDFDPDPGFDLTTDNCQKMLAMHVRFLCSHPVVVEGETGIGKTELARFYAKLKNGKASGGFIEVKVHGGTTKEDIKRHVNQAESCAQGETILFFDECNTSNAALQMVSELMTDGTLDGRNVCGGLKYVMAVNPYRKHTQEQIERLERSGLKQQSNTKTVLHDNIAHLVYRVFPLPPSLKDIVYDFGSLRPESEQQYISLLVERRLSQDPLKQSIVKQLHVYQNFMRSLHNEKAFVSLRDVKRCLDVYEFFLSQLCDNEHGTTVLQSLIVEHMNIDVADLSTKSRLRMLAWHGALGVAYYLSLKKNNRNDFVELANGETSHDVENLNENQDNDLELNLKVLMNIFMVQTQSILDHKQNIAQNTALIENVFLMAVCTQLRIPLFIVGKPGTSKSLAKSIIGDVMKGTASKSPLYRQLKRAKHVTYQCSHLSTAEGILNTFKECSQQQHEKNIEGGDNEQQEDGFVAVAVLDEIGLAESSDKMPLKALHPLLETGCSPRGIIEVKPKKTDKVGVIAISNWPLDPAKMNRGICVCRESLTQDQLEVTATNIISNNSLSKSLIKNICSAFQDIMTKQEGTNEIFGLRDFYAFLKMVDSELLKDDKSQEECLSYSIARNFSSCSLSSVDAIGILHSYIGISRKSFDGLKLLRDNLQGCDIIETRYPLLVPSGNVSDMLHLLEHSNVINLSSSQQSDHTSNMKVMCGSSFPEDRTYSRTCRMINELKLAIETGERVVLLNCSNIYESIYDVLNQFYVRCHNNKYVDIGLGSHRVKCRVHENAKIVIVARADEVLEQLPIPLINRLEKHEISLQNALSDELITIAEEIRDFADSIAGDDTAEYGFVGYGKETPFVLLAKAQLMSQRNNLRSVIDDECHQNEGHILPSYKRRKTNNDESSESFLSIHHNFEDEVLDEKDSLQHSKVTMSNSEGFQNQDNMEEDDVDMMNFEDVTEESAFTLNGKDKDVLMISDDVMPQNISELNESNEPNEVKQLSMSMLLNRALPSTIVKYCYRRNDAMSLFEQYFRSRDLKEVLRSAFNNINKSPALLLVTTYSPPLTRDDFLSEEEGYLADILPSRWAKTENSVQLVFLSDIRSQLELEEKVKSIPKEGGLLVIHNTPDAKLAGASTVNLLECAQYCIQNTSVGMQNCHILFIVQLPKGYKEIGLKQPHSFVTHSTKWQCEHLDTLFSASGSGILPPIYEMRETGERFSILLERIKKNAIDGNTNLLIRFFGAIVFPLADFEEMGIQGLGDRLWLVEALRRHTGFLNQDDINHRSSLVNCLTFCLNCMLRIAWEAEETSEASQRPWFYEQALAFTRDCSFHDFIEQRFLDASCSLFTIFMAYHNRFKNFMSLFGELNSVSLPGYVEWCSHCSTVVEVAKLNIIGNNILGNSHAIDRIVPTFTMVEEEIPVDFEARFPFFVGFYSILHNAWCQIIDFHGNPSTIKVTLVQKQIFVRVKELQEFMASDRFLPFTTREYLRQQYAMDLIGCLYARTTKNGANFDPSQMTLFSQVLVSVCENQGDGESSSNEVHSLASILHDIICVHTFFHENFRDLEHIMEVYALVAKLGSHHSTETEEPVLSINALKQKYHLDFLESALAVQLDDVSNVEADIQSALNSVEMHLSVSNDETETTEELRVYLQRTKLCQKLYQHRAYDLILNNAKVLHEIQPLWTLSGIETICQIIAQQEGSKDGKYFHLFVSLLSDTGKEMEPALISVLASWAAGALPLVRFEGEAAEGCRRFLGELLIQNGYLDQLVESCNTATNTDDELHCAAIVYMPSIKRLRKEEYSARSSSSHEQRAVKMFRQSIESVQKVANIAVTMTAIDVMDAVVAIQLAIDIAIESYFEVHEVNDDITSRESLVLELIEIAALHGVKDDQHHFLHYFCRAVHMRYGFEKLDQFIHNFPSVLPAKYQKILRGSRSQSGDNTSPGDNNKRQRNVYVIRKERGHTEEGRSNGDIYLDWVYYFNLQSHGMEAGKASMHPTIVTAEDKILAVLAGSNEFVFSGGDPESDEKRILGLSEVLQRRGSEFVTIMEKVRKFFVFISDRISKEEHSVFMLQTQLLIHMLVQLYVTTIEPASDSNQRLNTHPLLVECMNLIMGDRNGATLEDHIKGLFLPGMPQNVEEQLGRQRGDVTQWYACTKCGEKYGVGDCGKMSSTSTCAKCKHQIGGTNHAETNPATMSSEQWRGHILNSPSALNRYGRGAVRIQDGWGSGMQSIVLAVLHTSLCLGAIIECKSEMFESAEVWMKQLNRDTQDLQRHLNLQSTVDAVIILHGIVGRVLSDILLDEQGERRNFSSVTAAPNWSSSKNCEAWEIELINLIPNESMTRNIVERDCQKILNHTNDDSIELLLRLISIPKNPVSSREGLVPRVKSWVASMSNKSSAQDVLARFVVNPSVWKAKDSVGTFEHFRVAFIDHMLEQKDTDHCTFLSELFDRIEYEGADTFSFLSALPTILTTRWELQTMIEDSGLCTLTYEKLQEAIGEKQLNLLLHCIASMVCVDNEDEASFTAPQTLTHIREYFGTHGKLDTAIEKLVRIQNALVAANNEETPVPPQILLEPDRWNGSDGQYLLKHHIINIDVAKDSLPTLAAFCFDNGSYDFTQINNILYQNFVLGKAKLVWEKATEDEKTTVFQHFDVKGLRKGCNLLSTENYSKLLAGIRFLSRTSSNIDHDIKCVDFAARLVIGTQYDRNIVPNKDDNQTVTSSTSLLQFLEDVIDDVSSSLKDFLSDMDFLVSSDAVVLQSLLRVARSVDALREDRNPFMKDPRFAPSVSTIDTERDSSATITWAVDTSMIANEVGDIVYWSCAMHYMLLFWARNENERSMADTSSNFQDGFRFPNPDFPLVYSLDHAGFENFPNDDITTKETCSLFLDLVGRIPGWK